MALTQPAVSRTLRKLEEELGAQLFLRHPTGMELTSFGRALLPHAASLQTGMQRAREEVELLKGSSKGLARVGILPSLLPSCLSAVLNNALRKLPQIQIKIFEAPTHKLFFALSHGDIDFAIATFSRELSDSRIAVSPISDDQTCIVARAAHPVHKLLDVTPAALRGYRWALQEQGGSIWRHFRDLFTDAQLEPPDISLTADSIHTLKAALFEANLLTLLPRIAIRAEEAAGILRPVRPEQFTWRRQIVVIRRAIGPTLPAANLVLSEFREAIKGNAFR